jgi:hypothetical protein
MGRAAQIEAAGGQAALAARTAPDLAIMDRVRAALLGQLGGTMPPRAAGVPGPPCHMDRRTVTPLDSRQARRP